MAKLFETLQVEINLYAAAPHVPQQVAQVTRQVRYHFKRLTHTLAPTREQGSRGVPQLDDALHERRHMIDHMELEVELLPQSFQRNQRLEQQDQIGRQQ